MAEIRPTFYGEGVCVPGTNNITYVPHRKPMPCVVIFVHGVNSEGEWYVDAENGLLAGLNERLGRRDMKPNEYTKDGRTLRRSNNSPVIRFYWGYCAPMNETDNHSFEYKIPLKARMRFDKASDPQSLAAYSYHAYSHHYPEGKPDAPERPIEPNIKGATYYWGGGPFQNGTTSLNMSWYDGFDPNGVIDVGSRFVNPEIDRPLYKSPPRTYYAHASRRLADLIDSIYDKYPDDTVAVVSHSQGTMIALLAMLYVKRVPDTLFVCNSPYRMSNNVTDSITMGGQAPISRSHVKTFFNILDRFQAGKREPAEQDLNGVGGLVDPEPPAADDVRIVDGEGEKKDGPVKDRPMLADVPEPVRRVPWSPSQRTEEPAPGEDHHNHGRLFVYCSPHDRVMGSAPLESIGWKGIPAKGRDALEHPDQPRQTVNPFEKYSGVLFQRQFMRAHSVGGTPDPKDDAQTPRYPKDGRPVWIPESPRTMYVMREHVSIGKRDKIYVNGPRVPNPMPSGHDAAQRQTGQSPVPAQSMSMWDFNETIVSRVKLTHTADFSFYRELIYDRQRDMVPDYSDPYRKGPAFRPKTDAEIHAALSEMPAIPTNHSTILTYEQGELVKRVMAYDMPIGRADSFHDTEFWNELRRQADWLESDPYYLDAASRSSYECTSADGVPARPPEVDAETRAMAIAKANEERAREDATGVYRGS